MKNADEIMLRSAGAKLRRAVRKHNIREGVPESLALIMADVFFDCAEEEALIPGAGFSLLREAIREEEDDRS